MMPGAVYETGRAAGGSMAALLESLQVRFEKSFFIKKIVYASFVCDFPLLVAEIFLDVFP
jgi:hypothetical protein